MFLALTLKNHTPASDLGFLLHKHPDKKNTYDLSWGTAHVFFPQVNSTEATAVLLLDIDPIRLLKGSKQSGNPTLSRYVNDRPFVSSSLLSTAISKCFGTALSNRSHEKQDLANQELEFVVQITALPCKGREQLLHDLFEPLGYQVKAKSFNLSEKFVDWGKSQYYNLELSAKKKLGDLLSHLYVLIPVLDIEKHYWIGTSELDKLLRHGEGWLATHPSKQLIIRRYLRKSGVLVREALKQFKDLTISEEEIAQIEAETVQENAEESIEIEEESKPVDYARPRHLHAERHRCAIEVLKNEKITRIIDLGCGEGKFLKKLIEEEQFTEIVGLDVSIKSLEIAKDRLKLDRIKKNVKLLHGSLMYQDSRLSNFEAATVIEVIEHMEPYQLKAFESVLFKHAQPNLVIITTPNAEYNVLFENLQEGKYRHSDHRFEWSRKQFTEWASCVAKEYNYLVEFSSLGEEHPEYGAPSQMAIFKNQAL